MKLWRPLIGILLTAAVSMSTTDFVELQKLSPDDLRSRFGLPASCDPIVTASTTDPRANRVAVTIECRVQPGAIAPGRAPREGKGSS